MHSYLLEHGLKPDGHVDPNATDENAKSGCYETFFAETSHGKYVPRSIFVDLDPSVSDSPQIAVEELLLIVTAYR